ncbi:MAG: N-acetyl-gamma-glutamyl-phosphate reductase [Clostridiales bacterium]|nr:N-acetyl-gamma-glutamyl-phosphate reductase [Clostridiales bacterium]
MIKVSIIGSTGYAGIELVRLLNSHPQVSISHLISHSHVGKAVSDLYPNFRHVTDKICNPLDVHAISKDSDIVFTSLPHGKSDTIVQFLHKEGIKVIDLSADYRYQKVSTYENWYNRKHENPHLLKEAVYGLPEIYRNEIKNANIVGNPGCYGTAAILGLAPLVASKLIDQNSIIVDAKSGATGAGKSLSQGLHFCELSETMRAYKIASHRHTSEIEEILSLCSNEDIKLSFTPHLMPLKRGILCTMYANLEDSFDFNYIYDVYTNFYAKEAFIEIYNDNIIPEPKFVNGSNSCHIGFVVDERLNRIIVVSVIDNLIKGASGQAIQNMNIMFGIDETMGLDMPGWYL